MAYNFTAEITYDNEINQYIGIVPGLPGAHSQASTLDELYSNLQDVIQLCLKEMSNEENWNYLILLVHKIYRLSCEYESTQLQR